MNGRVDEGGRALIVVVVRSQTDLASQQVEAWLDTGFTGDLVLPQSMIADLELTQSGTLSAELGDGSEAVLNTYSCVVDWLGSRLEIEVIANSGTIPLLGVGLLRDHVLTIDYPSKSLRVE